MSDDERNLWAGDDYGDEENESLQGSDNSDYSDQNLDNLIKHQEQFQQQLNEKENISYESQEQSSEEESQIFHPNIKNLSNAYRPPTYQQIMPTPVKITSPFMTKYEFAHILGKRAQQISKNSPLYVQLDQKEAKKYDILEIAQMELKAKKLPFIIRRNLPNGYYQDWSVSQLIIHNL